MLVSCQAGAQSYTYFTFDPPGSVSTTDVRAINNSGQIVGAYKDASGLANAFVREADGVTYTPIEVPGSIPGHTIATAINNAGQIVGVFDDAAGTHAFLRSADGKSFNRFDVPAAQPYGYPTGINDRGEIAGRQFNAAGEAYGFLRSADGATYTKIQMPQALYTGVTGINNGGQIVGLYHMGGSESLEHGFLRDSAGNYTSFDIPGRVQGTLPSAINNRGQILAAPFILNPDRTTTALDPGFGGLGYGINDTGAVAGVSFSNPVYHGLLAIPTASTPAPAIRTASGVISASAFGGSDQIAPGTWIEIYGANLAGTTREWQAADFNGNTAPTSLDGVSVAINGRAAFVAYVSPGQVNALAPATLASGPATLTVTTGGRTSGAYRTTVNAVQPGLLSIATDAHYAVTARAGDALVFYGIGFGPVTPVVPTGQIAAGLDTLVGDLQVTFNGVPAQVSYAGLAPETVGLYQFNVVVPEVQLGVNTIQFSLNGVSLPRLLIAAAP
jgi:uncharacterized protein (TIGR03437 family)